MTLCVDIFTSRVATIATSKLGLLLLWPERARILANMAMIMNLHEPKAMHMHAYCTLSQLFAQGKFACRIMADLEWTKLAIHVQTYMSASFGEGCLVYRESY